MATQTIQSNIMYSSTLSTPKVVVDSSGRFYSAYNKLFGGTYYLTMAYSDDSGATWTEVTSALAFQAAAFYNIALGIDSTNKLHVAYTKGDGAGGFYIIAYRSFSSGAWNGEETIFDGTANTDIAERVDLAVDSSDVPHVTWSQQAAAGTTYQVWYNNRSGGSWGTRVQISTTAANNNGLKPTIAIDNNNVIYIIWYDVGVAFASANFIYAARYAGSWVGPTQLDTNSPINGSFSMPSIAIDVSNNAHVVYHDTTSTAMLRYVKYTSGSGWGAASTIYSNSDYFVKPTIAVDSSSNLNVVGQSNSDNKKLFYTQYTGSWSAPTTIYTGGSNSNVPTILSSIFAFIGGSSTNIPTAGYFLVFVANTSSVLTLITTSDLTFVTPITKNYSREASGSLPSTDSPLTSLFTSSEYTEVALQDNVYASQTATGQYAIFQFRNKASSNTDQIHVTWIGKTNIAPSTATVALQIYNVNGAAWETLATDHASAANANFTLTGSQTTNLPNYYDGSTFVSCRVYQLSP